MGAQQTQHLLPGERVVTSNKFFTLTNYRVFRDTMASGQSRYVSITLDAVSSCGLVTNSQPILLVLAALSAIAGFALQGEWQAIGVIGGLFFAIMYFATRSAVFSICSAGGERMTVPAGADQRAWLMTFLNAIDQEKLTALGRIPQSWRADTSTPPPPPPVARVEAGPRGTW